MSNTPPPVQAGGDAIQKAHEVLLAGLKRTLADRRVLEEFDPNDPRVQYYLLAQSVETIRKEKESLERTIERLEERLSSVEDGDNVKVANLESRVRSVENSITRGHGALIAFPVFGTIMAILIAYGKYIFGKGSQ